MYLIYREKTRSASSRFTSGSVNYADGEAPELVAVDRAQHRERPVREAAQRRCEQYWPRVIRRVPRERVGEHERMREVRVGARDQREGPVHEAAEQPVQGVTD